ncbi:XdhC family protein [Aestuariispira insulae]|uniref:Putative sulfurylase large subunit (Molybdopterin cytosine dinucleotide biosynthesis) n=1 Tax=Aestuariispira insulae TaxID=1461337 RepID=A0A3D9HNC8_9PROT|nr:XdhC family protein [Aestuariispira insulae]RED50968.1 putative sulfurylase large subunit (molybdopterin cytosine dinucleotide biosynthesis) [Aestuariispira insulae]
MKLSTLDNLLSEKERKLPCVLVTRLGDGHQVLWSEYANLSKTEFPEILADACRDALLKDKGCQFELADERYFLQVHNPPKRLLIVGAVHISQFLAPMAVMSGYGVTLIDPRGAWATQERFPGIPLDKRWPDEALADLAPDARTAIVTLTHDPKLDDPALEFALRSECFYLGALGSRKTHGKRVERLAAIGFGEADTRRIAAPVGLDIGAISPAEIAVSILAEMTLSLHGPRRKTI